MDEKEIKREKWPLHRRTCDSDGSRGPVNAGRQVGEYERVLFEGPERLTALAASGYVEGGERAEENMWGEGPLGKVLRPGIQKHWTAPGAARVRVRSLQYLEVARGRGLSGEVGCEDVQTSQAREHRQYNKGETL